MTKVAVACVCLDLVFACIVVVGVGGMKARLVHVPIQILKWLQIIPFLVLIYSMKSRS